MSLRLLTVVGFCVLSSVLSAVLATPLQAARMSEQETVRRASAALEQIMSAPAAAIPRRLLSDAQAIVIVPQIKNAAFVVGIRKGFGVLVVRENHGLWRAPQFVEMTGGSLGWQAGVKSSDLILVFRNRQSLDNLMKGKLTLGVDASAAAGPVGRQVAAGTDLELSAEIYSYSRSRGAFAGVSVGGTVLKLDPHAGTRYYQQSNTVPPAAGKLVGQLAAYSGAAVAMETSPPSPAAPASSVIGNQRQLIEAAEQLSALLDPTWRQYLALPKEIYQTKPLEADLFAGLDACLQRYETTAANPQYATLTKRPEFQLVLVSLRQESSLLPADAITLPPPPTAAQPSNTQSTNTKSTGPLFPQ